CSAKQKVNQAESGCCTRPGRHSVIRDITFLAPGTASERGFSARSGGAGKVRMPVMVQVPVEGKTAAYKGVYRPHWEVAHIAVRVPRAGFSLRSLTFPTLVLLGALALFFCGLLKPADAYLV